MPQTQSFLKRVDCHKQNQLKETKGDTTKDQEYKKTEERLAKPHHTSYSIIPHLYHTSIICDMDYNQSASNTCLNYFNKKSLSETPC